MSVGECSCHSHTTSEGSESTVLVAFLYSPFMPETAKTKSPVEMQLSFESDNDVS